MTVHINIYNKSFLKKENERIKWMSMVINLKVEERGIKTTILTIKSK
jgi:hypothetical protein